MANFSSVKEMLEQMLLPIVEKIIEQWKNTGEKLEMTTTLLIKGGEE